MKEREREPQYGERFPGANLVTRLTIMLLVLSLWLPTASPSAYAEPSAVRLSEPEIIIVDGGSTVTGAVYGTAQAVIDALEASVTSAWIKAEDDTRVLVDVKPGTWEEAGSSSYNSAVANYYHFWAELNDPPTGYANPSGTRAYVMVAVKGQDVPLFVSPLPVAEPGMKQGTTKLTGLPPLEPWSGGQYVIRVTSSPTPIPNEIDSAPPGYEGFVAYSGSADIAGVDAVTNKYVALYKVAGFGKIVAFSEIELTADDIADSDWLIPDFPSTLKAEPGTKPGTTKLSGVTPEAGHTLSVQISSEPIDRPAAGVALRQDTNNYPPSPSIMDGSEFVNHAYAMGANIAGADVMTNKYIALYEKDSADYVTRFSQIELTAGSFSQRDFTDMPDNLRPVAPKPTASSLRDVTYGNGIYVAVGSEGTILTSEDGMEWESRDSGTSRSLESVAFLNEQFVAVGDFCTVLLSSDGQTWADHSFANDNCYLRSVAYGDVHGDGQGTLVAVSSVVGTSVLQHVFISRDDGVTWEAPSYSDNVQYHSFSDVIFANGKFIATGQGFRVYENFSWRIVPPAVLVSADEGDTWQIASNVTVDGLAFADNVLYGLISNGGTNLTLHVSDDDGVNWVSRNIASSRALQGFAHDGHGSYVWVGEQDMILASTDSGLTWANKLKATGLSDSGFFEVQFTGAAFGDDGRIVIVGGNGVVLTQVTPPPAPDFDPLPDAEPGTAAGTTKLPSVTLGKSSNKLMLRVNSSPADPALRPYVWDDTPIGVTAYTIGDDIGGVDATTNKYVELYETSPSGKILSFSVIELTSADIRSGSSGGGTAPAPGFGSTPTAQPGTQPGTTTLNGVTAGAGNQLKVLVGSGSTPQPNVGDAVPIGASNYTAGSDISGVDAATNKYIAVYEVDGAGKIVRFSEIALSSSDINSGSSGGGSAQPPALTADDSDNDTDHSIEITFTDDATWRGAITEVSVDGAALSTADYTVAAGKLTIHGDVLSGGTHTVTVKATGYADASVIQSVNLPGKPANPQQLTAVAGDASVQLGWNAVPGALYYNVYVSETSQGFDDEKYVTITGATTYQVPNLVNGKTYYFVVKAGIGNDLSAASNEVSAEPGSTGTGGSPGAPKNVTAIAGNGEATVSFTPPANNGGSAITGYKVISEPGGITATGTTSPITVTGLTNDTTYTFKVVATNSAGDSPASAPSASVTPTAPAGSPGAPTNVTAVPGNGLATISFTPPANDGGNSITGYIVTSHPGSLTATGAASPITITGLTNGTSYTFTVKAINAAGSSAASTASSTVVPSAPTGGDGGNSGGDSGGSGGGANGGTSGSSNEEAVIVLVNGKEESAGTATTGKRNDQTLLTIAIDQKKLDDKLAAEGQGAVVTIPVKTKSDVIIGELNGQMVKNMENKEAVLVLQTDNATYTIPAHEINIDAIFSQLGKPANLADIKVRIEISASTAETVKLAENAAEKGTFSLVMPPLEFNITAVYGSQSVNVTKFNAYVERTVAIPDGIDPNKITTGVVIEADGSVRHVPTQVTKNGARYFAKINSLTNSTYAVVWNPIEFSDVAKHWAKSAVNDMGSRMVIDGTGGGKFTPNRDITRAEFAAILVRGLGLKPESGATAFSDVKASDWYSGVINTAYVYRLIDGFEDGTFRPQDKITREQAMLILSKAMVLTGLADTWSAKSADAVLHPFGDAAKVAKWAQNGVSSSVQAGIVTGRSADTLAPKANMTRAEVAAIIQRLLQKSELIEVK
ncbi:S-layer homology domain-containing protein [Cohnella sp.]|uniref:S-layer homology domain-containing protein n=1 Tax=Cohnella sp. TaxID=1883426 RepID=UPI0035648208